MSIEGFLTSRISSNYSTDSPDIVLFICLAFSFLLSIFFLNQLLFSSLRSLKLAKVSLSLSSDSLVDAGSDKYCKEFDRFVAEIRMQKMSFVVLYMFID